MKNIITFSGWGQDYDALENIAPGANHINYKDYDDIESLFASLKNTPCDILIGWSLGGQLALRAIEADILKPERLVLISTPFQFIASDSIRCGINMDSFIEFENDFTNDPEKTLKQFANLIARGDKDSAQIARTLRKSDKADAKKWFYWLNELRKFSCKSMNYDKVPPTLAISGSEDSIIEATQIDLFRPLIRSGYKTAIFDKCGHAPHLHDEKKVRDLIAEVA
jgi:pimeloyl-ACP methyl ester carboxylesterase